MPSSKIEECSTSATDIQEEKIHQNLSEERRKGFMGEMTQQLTLILVFWFCSLRWFTGAHIQPSLDEGQFQGCHSLALV